MLDLSEGFSIPGSSEELHARLHRFSHDLKNKMGGLWQALKLLQDLPEGPERDELLVFAERSYFSGAQAVEKLMDDLAVPRGNEKLRKEDVDLTALMGQCIEGTAFRTQKKEQQVVLKAVPVHLQGDRELLRNIFEALLSNASKFSPPGSPVQVHLTVAGNLVRIEVEDHGVGLTEDDLGEVFTRYALLSSRSTAGESQARGTLARVRQWVKAHDGEIAAQSAGPGKGTRFTVRLPL
jgi:signal transduction histidine kinase